MDCTEYNSVTVGVFSQKCRDIKISHKELLAVDVDSHPLPLASLSASVATKLLLEEFERVSVEEELLAASKAERVPHHLLLLVVAHDH